MRTRQPMSSMYTSQCENLYRIVELAVENRHELEENLKKRMITVKKEWLFNGWNINWSKSGFPGILMFYTEISAFVSLEK